uniref:Uncharacterized protein n=1 Tax=Glossina palpalis gambiensis TaxID=67801 RepID=A0A1B0B5Y8_9MUSC
MSTAIDDGCGAILRLHHLIIVNINDSIDFIISSDQAFDCDDNTGIHVTILLVSIAYMLIGKRENYTYIIFAPNHYNVSLSMMSLSGLKNAYGVPNSTSLSQIFTPNEETKAFFLFTVCMPNRYEYEANWLQMLLHVLESFITLVGQSLLGHNDLCHTTRTALLK